MTTATQPLNKIHWINRDNLRANDYNPNTVAPPELRLLKISILENGWTQPIVARSNGEIVDGFHRWTVSADEQIAALTDGLIPVVYLSDATDEATQQMATIRHNRARGQHSVVPMADIVHTLHNTHGLDTATISQRLQMEDEEVTRLLERGNKLTRGSNPDGFNAGWKPTRNK